MNRDESGGQMQLLIYVQMDAMIWEFLEGGVGRWRLSITRRPTGEILRARRYNRVNRSSNLKMPLRNDGVLYKLAPIMNRQATENNADNNVLCPRGGAKAYCHAYVNHTNPRPLANVTQLLDFVFERFKYLVHVHTNVLQAPTVQALVLPRGLGRSVGSRLRDEAVVTNSGR